MHWSAYWPWLIARRPFSMSCNLSGIGILTLRFVRKPPGWPRVETARCRPLPRASLSAWATCSEENPATDGATGAEPGVELAGGVGVCGVGLASSVTFATRAFVDAD